MRSRLLEAITLVSLAVALPASAQTAPASAQIVSDCGKYPAVCVYGSQLNALVTAKQEAHAATDDNVRSGKELLARSSLDVLLLPVTAPEFIVLALGKGGFTNSIIAWENARLDKQVGAPAKGSASTDLASRPSTPDLLGLALQLGALTETVSGTTATFNANAEGSYRAIIGKPAVCLSCADTFWTDLNFSATFDLSRPGSQQVMTAGAANSSTTAPAMVQLPQSSRQLSSISARYDIQNPLDPRSPQFKTAWAAAYKNHLADLTAEAQKLTTTVAEVTTPLAKDAELNALAATERPKLEKLAAAGDFSGLDKEFESYFETLVQKVRQKVPDLDQKVAAAVEAFAAYAQLNYAAVQEARGKPQFTAQYTFSRPQSQPDTHDLKLIVGLSPGPAGSLFTLNLAGTLYGQVPAGANYRRLRDFQLAAQFDRPLGTLMNHPATLTLAGYLQYQFDPSVLDIGPGNLAPGTNIMLPQNAQVLLGTKGVLAILQAKITLNTNSGMNIPIAISWANKTDLLNANEVRGHVGISYDFSSISQAFGGQSGQ
ncbi:MAG TPA: hypothetical protein VN999_14630 [Thermoanaerobaculia bacterium]|nr:hypothetical protein [Thermoanaerobaculia bacterium]